MKLVLNRPKKTLNKAYLKAKVSRSDIERFKANLSSLFDRINENESEEHLKNVLAEFLKATWYRESNEINTKGRSDLVIYNGKTAKDSPGVIIEVKHPSNKSEMLKEDKINAKALHELILYYLRERLEHNSTNIKHLIVTNIYEWYVFDEVWFEINVYRNNKLRKEFENWKLSGKDTRFFYESIAKSFLDASGESIECAYFDLREYKSVIENASTLDDSKLIALYKVLSPANLLKLPFANDSNSLDTKFYTELLHIIGLEERKEGGRKLIKRKAKPSPASILENVIMRVEDKDCLRSIANVHEYGTQASEQVYNIGLELTITWINRILFLKLLEAQLVKYHKGSSDYLFLNSMFILDFDGLNNLFFRCLLKDLLIGVHI